MKKFLLIGLSCCVAVCMIVVSCSRSVRVPLSYSVTDTTGKDITAIYIPDSGAFEMPVWVKFLSGNVVDKVTLTFTGLPDGVNVTPDSVVAKPSYIQRFVFYTNKAARGNYPVTITAYSPSTGYRYYRINLGIIPAKCAGSFIGRLKGSNSCSRSGKFPYDATTSYGNTTSVLVVNNFGGYGSNVNVHVLMDCSDDSCFIIYKNYGNNTWLSGKGTFTDNKMIISYNATSTPTGGADNCVDTLRVVP